MRVEKEESLQFCPVKGLCADILVFHPPQYSVVLDGWREGQCDIREQLRPAYVSTSTDGSLAVDLTIPSGCRGYECGLSESNLRVSIVGVNCHVRPKVG